MRVLALVGLAITVVLAACSDGGGGAYRGSAQSGTPLPDDPEALLAVALDTTFNGTGFVTIAVGTGDDIGSDVIISPDGKIVVVGRSFDGVADDVALVRLNSDGSLDTSFDGDGILTTPVGPNDDQGNSVIIQPDGKIAVGGSSEGASGWDIAVIRYLSDGALDVP